MVKKIKKTTKKVYNHVPRGPAPWTGNREKKMIKFEKDMKICKKQWTNELEERNFDLYDWHFDHYRNENDIRLLVEIMKEKIDQQRKELNKMKKSERRNRKLNNVTL
jgi:hypothetical protein